MKITTKKRGELQEKYASRLTTLSQKCIQMKSDIMLTVFVLSSSKKVICTFLVMFVIACTYFILSYTLENKEKIKEPFWIPQRTFQCTALKNEAWTHLPLLGKILGPKSSHFNWKPHDLFSHDGKFCSRSS